MTYQLERSFKDSDICVGDIVKITNIGHYYPTFTKAFKFFFGDDPHYDARLVESQIPHGDKRPWRVMAIAEHEFFNTLICYIQDMNRNKLVIGIEGIRPIRRVNKDRNTIIKVPAIN